MDTKITIKDTTVENYNTRSSYSFLDFLIDGESTIYHLYDSPHRNFCEYFNIAILVENVNFTNNSVPFFAPEIILSICLFMLLNQILHYVLKIIQPREEEQYL